MKIWCAVCTFIILSFVWYITALFVPDLEHKAYQRGLIEGSRDYHNRCTYPGGVMVDETSLIMVQCRGIGKMTKKELLNAFK